MRRSLVRGAVSTMIGNAWAMVLTLALLPVMLSGLGRTGFGLWVLIQTLSAITGWFSLADLGTGIATTRSVAAALSEGDRDAASRWASAGLVVHLVCGIGSGVVVATVGPLVLPALFNAPSDLRGPLRLAIVVAGAQIVVDLVIEGLEACLEGIQRIDLSRIVDGLRRTLVAVGTAVVAVTSGSLVAVAVTSLVLSAAGTVAAAVITVPRLPPLRRVPAGDVRALLRLGRGVAVLRPLGVLQRTMDRALVGVILGPSAVAGVEVATQVMNGVEAVVSGSSYAVVPSASWLQARQADDGLRALLLRGTRYTTMAAWLVAAGAAVLAAPLLRLWLDESGSGAVGLAVLAVAASAVAAPAQVSSSLLVGIGRTGDILRAALIAIVVNLALSAVLIHLVGAIGTFVGTLAANLLIVPLLVRPALARAGVGWAELARSAILPAAAPAIGFGSVALAVRLLGLSDLLTVIVAVAGGGVIGAAALWSVGLAKQDRALIVARLKPLGLRR
jgi:O-antigen/teichoic acid export membrane protein